MPVLLPLKANDYRAILELTRESMEPGGGEPGDFQFSEDLFRDMIADGDATTLVMWEGDAMVGYVTFYPGEDHLFVNWLVVHPDYRNRGLATLLLEEVGRAAAQRGLASLRTCLQESNLAAIALCDAAGFRRVGHGPMGLVMEKTVVPERGE